MLAVELPVSVAALSSLFFFVACCCRVEDATLIFSFPRSEADWCEPWFGWSARSLHPFVADRMRSGMTVSCERNLCRTITSQ